MNGPEPEEILNRAAGAPHEVDPALLARISDSLVSGLRPVRPLPPAWVLASALFAITAAVALAGGTALGLKGIARLNALEITSIFGVLGAFTWISAVHCVAETTPGSRRRLSSGTVLAAGSLVLAGVFALLFHDYRTTRFVHQGLVCLTLGLAHGLAAGLAGWLVLRRGFAVNPMAAGLAVGTLASLAGVGMLELHCPNLETLHVVVWHTAVIPVSAFAGVLLARFIRRNN
ncbi:MAG TPA: NrsF family protein [Candidatus Acidoferrales bacterium]|nr:NrsF family protein [Candidatus Acidoferrales bacterium]